jgi:hypothetical protein
MTKPSAEPTERTWQLQHGITLTVDFGRPAPPLGAIASFLSAILNYFKERRDTLHEDLYREGPPKPGGAIYGRKFYGNCYLVHEGDREGHYLPTETWVKAIIAAHTAATTVIDIAENLEAYRTQADGWLVEVVGALGKRHGDLDAFEFVLNRANAQLFQGP